MHYYKVAPNKIIRPDSAFFTYTSEEPYQVGQPVLIEVGHWLGHDHKVCSGVGQLAAVMQQQSISLGGCNFNPWPLDSELWSTQLGIYL